MGNIVFVSSPKNLTPHKVRKDIEEICLRRFGENVIVKISSFNMISVVETSGDDW